MTLRGPGRHRLLVQRYELVTGGMGQDERVAQGDPVPVRGNLYPLTADESESLGLVNTETRAFHIHHGRWPGDQHSVATHGGKKWEQVGPVVDYEMGMNTRHQRVILRWVGAAT